MKEETIKKLKKSKVIQYTRGFEDGYEKGKSSRDSQQEIEPKGNIKPSADTIQKEIEEIRKEFSELLRDINWETRRGCMPYDWNTYGLPHIVKLCDLLRVDLSDEHLLKQDKRGSWR